MTNKWTATIDIAEYNRLKTIERNFQKEITKYEEEYELFKKENALCSIEECTEEGINITIIAWKGKVIDTLKEEIENLKQNRDELYEEVKILEKRPEKCILF